MKKHLPVSLNDINKFLNLTFYKHFIEGDAGEQTTDEKHDNTQKNQDDNSSSVSTPLPAPDSNKLPGSINISDTFNNNGLLHISILGISFVDNNIVDVKLVLSYKLMLHTEWTNHNSPSLSNGDHLADVNNSSQLAQANISWSDVVARGNRKKAFVAVSPAQPGQHPAPSDGSESYIYNSADVNPQICHFSFFNNLFEKVTDAYKATEHHLGKADGFRNLSKYKTRRSAQLILVALFRQAEVSRKTLSEGFVYNNMTFKATPSMVHAERSLVHLQLILLHIPSKATFLEDLLSSLKYYGKVCQVKQLLREGYFEGIVQRDGNKTGCAMDVVKMDIQDGFDIQASTISVSNAVHSTSATELKTASLVLQTEQVFLDELCEALDAESPVDMEPDQTRKLDGP
ncbi:hypothetical protein G6F57_000324 [Rhizopus arrhizus]|nr:hypothetical protein G6F30_001026 [Rhizopus arrhizus]KAG1429261.1 hypothetical protein G6F58_000118 [Rhizopus delemar]KAG0988419.1 hypothetical protein G6F29_001765 [Rhizopus arrhizus]KAG0999122.1 hypothetical protein G6F28_001307 [Rhizopus arrhizus]KAG1013677.1 hypothetical protein G6F27_001663 [Rhizopus arrhizus]